MNLFPTYKRSCLLYILLSSELDIFVQIDEFLYVIKLFSKSNMSVPVTRSIVRQYYKFRFRLKRSD